MNNIVRKFSAMNPGHFRKCKRKAGERLDHAITNQHLASPAKRTGTQRRTKLSI